MYMYMYVKTRISCSLQNVTEYISLNTANDSDPLVSMGTDRKTRCGPDHQHFHPLANWLDTRNGNPGTRLMPQQQRQLL